MLYIITFIYSTSFALSILNFTIFQGIMIIYFISFYFMRAALWLLRLRFYRLNKFCIQIWNK